MSTVQIKYKLRAECQHDVDEFVKAAGANVSAVAVEPGFLEIGNQKIPIPDVDMAFESPLDMPALREIMKTITDTHVMQQSLNLADVYDGDRWFDEEDEEESDEADEVESEEESE